MLHYASGAPANDDFQVVENQLARQRLFSVHPDQNKPLRRWVEDVRAGIHSFRDQLKRTPSLSGKLARADSRMRSELAERGHDPSAWVPYEDALLTLRCLIPSFDGAILSNEWRDALWAKFYTGAPPRQRQSVERYSIVKRA